MAVGRCKPRQLGCNPGVDPYLVLGLTTLVFTGYALNLLQFGDDQATQMD